VYHQVPPNKGQPLGGFTDICRRRLTAFMPDLEKLIDIPTPPTPHAFLITPVVVHDPGRGSLIDLELPGGTYLRAQAAPDVLRLGANLGGAWKATLHFETQPNARLQEPLQLTRLSPLTALEAVLLPSWGATGRVIKLDRIEGFVVIEVIPKKKEIPSFTLTAIVSIDQLSSIENASHVRLKGRLSDCHLVVAQLEVSKGSGNTR
jgi:hypothetical protein